MRTHKICSSPVVIFEMLGAGNHWFHCCCGGCSFLGKTCRDINLGFRETCHAIAFSCKPQEDKNKKKQNKKKKHVRSDARVACLWHFGLWPRANEPTSVQNCYTVFGGVSR